MSLLQRYPAPTAAGTANNFSRLANEVDDQDQADVRIDHKFASNRDQAFGRLTYFHDRFLPVTPLPDGSGVTAGTLGPQDTAAWSFASNYQHMFSSNVLNEVRIGDTRRTVGRTAAQLATSAGSALSIPGIPSNARFPNTLPTFLVAGYQQLGSPPNTASNFHTSVSEVADSLTWLKGRHTLKMGLDFRWERLDVIQPPSPTGAFTFNAIGSDLPGRPTPARRSRVCCWDRCRTSPSISRRDQIQERARFQEYFIQDDWKVSDRLTINPGLRYTLNFPSNEINGQTAVFNLQTQQLEYPGTNPVRPLKKNNFGPRLGGVYRLTDRTIVSAGYGMVWIEMAGITTPFTTPTFPFLQTVSQRALDTISPAFVLQNGPTVAAIPQTPTAGLGQGVFAVDATLGSGYVQQWNVSMQRELTTNTAVEVSYIGSFITHVGIPDSNLNQLTVDQLALGSPLLTRVPNPYFGIVPRSSSLGDPTIPAGQLLKPFPSYTTVSLYRNNVGTTRYQGLALSLRRRFSHGVCVLRGVHPLQARRRCLVGVRRVDPDRTDRELPGRRQLQPRARARLLDGRHPARVRLVGRLGSAGRLGPRPAPGRRARRPGERLDGHRHRHAGVRHPARGDADDQLQRVRRLRRAAAESRGRSGIAGRRAHHQPLVQHRRLCGHASVRDRLVLAQSGARTRRTATSTWR